MYLFNVDSCRYEENDGLVRCNRCGFKQPIKNFQNMDAGEVKRLCKTCRSEHQKVGKKLRESNEYPPDNYCCPICLLTLAEMTEADEANKQHRLTVWFLDHDHITLQFRGWLCHKCNYGLGAFGDDVNKLRNAVKYLLETAE